MKKQKLSLAKETLRALTPDTLSDVVGGNASAAAAVCRHSAAAILCRSAAAAVTCLHLSANATVCHRTVMNHAV
jgi:hypothetical protein